MMNAYLNADELKGLPQLEEAELRQVIVSGIGEVSWGSCAETAFCDFI